MEKEKSKIVSFIKNILRKQSFKKVVIGLSGGVDSTTTLYLLAKSISPENIIPAHLPYQISHENVIKKMLNQLKIPRKNFEIISVKTLVETFVKLETTNFFRDLLFEERSDELSRDKKFRRLNRIRLGNIMARVRMIILYDLAKKYNALVCGTENRSEFYLGYFTRFGDEASDFEPLRTLYKTEVYKLAKSLKVPEEAIKQTPTAGLWDGQTDEKEFGFSYTQADPVLSLYFDKKLSLAKIEKRGFEKVKKIISFALKNQFKHKTPYIL